MILKTLSTGRQPVYYVQKNCRNEDGKPSSKYVDRLGTLEDLEKRFGGRRSRRRTLFHHGSAGFSSDTQIVTRKAMKSVIASIKPSKDEKDNDEA